MPIPAPASIASVSAASAVAAVIAFVVASLLVRHATAWGLQDLPNARSSHQRPTPRGGGIAVALAFLLALPWCLPPASLGAWPVWVPLGAAIMLTLVGLADDLRGLGLAVRLAAQAVAVTALLVALPSVGWPVPSTWLPAGLWPGFAIPLAIVLAAVLVVAGVWWINLFNFMDGIDGLAVTQALFMLVAAVAVKLIGPGLDGASRDLLASPAAAASLVLAAAVAGFLLLNWAPAKIFLGDAGSLFLGFSILATAVHDVTCGDMNLWSWLILGALFIVDATVTLLRRSLTGQRVTTAHRSHVYQRLSRRWGGHRGVTLVYCLVNVTWLLPLAILAHRVPSWAPMILAMACVPLAAIAWRAGAGLKET